MIRRALLLSTLLALPTAAQVELHEAPAAEAGLTVEGLAEVDAYLAGLVDDGRAVGVSALISRHGKVAYRAAHGERVRGSGEPLGTDAIFRIYSMTKPVTAVATMMLIEEGLVGLDDPVAEYLPELAEVKVATHPPGETPTLDNMELVAPRTTMTVRHLLNHTSGFVYGFFTRGPVPTAYMESGLWNPELTLDEFVEVAGQLPLLHDPGQRMSYSISSDLLGGLVQRVSGQPFEEFLAERIFAPLGMVDTGFHVPEEKQDRLAEIYDAGPDGKIAGLNARVHEQFLRPPAMPSGGGGLVSTLDDYARFLQMLMDRGALGDGRLLEERTVDLMTTIADPIAPAMQYGLGFMIVHDGEAIGRPATTSQYSWGGLARTAFLVNPEQDLFVVFLTNVLPASQQFELELYPLVYDALEH